MRVTSSSLRIPQHRTATEYLQNNFQNGKKTMGIKQKREPCFTTPFHSLSLQNLIQLYIHDSAQRRQPV